jgi:uncharacterized membrane protein
MQSQPIGRTIRLRRFVWIVVAVVAVVLVVYVIATLEQKSTCIQRGGHFTYAVPTVCTYPPGSPYAP